MTSAGFMYCTGLQSGQADPNGVAFTYRVESQAAGVVNNATAPLMRCEPQDYQTYSSLVMAFFGALVSILCVRLVYTNIFKGDKA